MQSVKKLTLVFVQSLYLYVENTVGVYRYTVCFLYIFGKTNLIRSLYFRQLFRYVAVVLQRQKFFKLRRVLNPAVAYLVGDEVGKERIGFRHPSSVSDTVGYVGEFFGGYFVVVCENGVFKNIAVQYADAVNGVACRKAEISHSDYSVAHYRVGGDFIPLIGINFP